MGQITLYLDSETEKKMGSAAKAAGLSKSRWVAELIQQKIRNEWPKSVVRLAGAWKDLEEATELREGLGEDIPREAF